MPPAAAFATAETRKERVDICDGSNPAAITMSFTIWLAVPLQIGDVRLYTPVNSGWVLLLEGRIAISRFTIVITSMVGSVERSIGMCNPSPAWSVLEVGK